MTFSPDREKRFLLVAGCEDTVQFNQHWCETNFRIKTAATLVKLKALPDEALTALAIWTKVYWTDGFMSAKASKESLNALLRYSREKLAGLTARGMDVFVDELRAGAKDVFEVLDYFLNKGIGPRDCMLIRLVLEHLKASHVEQFTAYWMATP